LGKVVEVGLVSRNPLKFPLWLRRSATLLWTDDWEDAQLISSLRTEDEHPSLTRGLLWDKFIEK
jgi:hypothetical protein